MVYPPTPDLIIPDLIISDSDPESINNWASYRRPPTRAWSTVSCETQTTSSASLLSPVQTERSDTLTVRSCWSRGPSPLGRRTRNSSSDSNAEPLFCLGPRCQQKFTSEEELKAHVASVHTHTCNWANCDQPSFTSHADLVWHVKADHLFICPFSSCAETSLQSAPAVQLHMNTAHAKSGKTKAMARFVAQSDASKAVEKSDLSPKSSRATNDKPIEDKSSAVARELFAIKTAKAKYQEKLRLVLDKRSKRNVSNFPLVFEHSILPFLTEFLPKWAGPHHVVSVMRGKVAHSRRICIMTRQRMSRARRMIIVRHIQDLLPDKFRRHVSFVFSVGEVKQLTWARGLSRNHLDDVCAPRNPYFFQSPCMGDSIGIRGNGSFEDSTATLGPTLVLGGVNFWLGNFHPFLEAYQNSEAVEVEHPSREDRSRCIGENHDALAQEHRFGLGKITVTSGFNLKTTRISHDSYWEECDMDQPLVVTDWSLISSKTSHANLLRRFPSETQPLLKDIPITSTGSIVPGAYVACSGRTSGHQRGQICEIPAYVSGDENGTQRATREWFIEEPQQSDDEEEWIRGGIGVEGDSGAAVVNLGTNTLIGQLWGRNRYWGPGPRHTFFTPISDIFDDIQEKCGEQTRPYLPQHRDEADCYPLYPSCRQCYDLRTYLDSRRTSRISLQSMIMGRGDADQDLTSIEAASELATPRDYHRYGGIEEMGSSFNVNSNTSPSTPAIADIKSPYATTLDFEDLYDTHLSIPEGSRKRGSVLPTHTGPEKQKRQRVG
ncbi:hypothetical protein BGZ63DRAFT_345793 [Mariannaea sp. PMI_226]|nr:hypothetical protein BGZ63DRAFT_345793 [Mariannaea sp. PMI_226]